MNWAISSLRHSATREGSRTDKPKPSRDEIKSHSGVSLNIAPQNRIHINTIFFLRRVYVHHHNHLTNMENDSSVVG